MATTGTAMQGLSAAIVIQAINLISEFAYKADERMNQATTSNIYDHILGMPTMPKSAQDPLSDSTKMAGDALRPATRLVADAGRDVSAALMPTAMESAVVTFFDNYLSFVDQNFPGLQSGGGAADRLAGAAFGGAGLTHSEVVDGVAADTAFAWSQQDAYAQERALVDERAAAGHRFLPGAAFSAIARMHAAAIRPAAEAAAQAHAARAALERQARMDLARAATAHRVDRIKKVTDQALDAFMKKIRARGLQNADRESIVGTTASTVALSSDYQTRLAELALSVAERRQASMVAAGKANDRSVEIAKANYSNGQELVDLLGNMVTTLFNQVRANGSYSGSERDVTDWDSMSA